MNKATKLRVSEGFPRQRLVILQPSVVKNCQQLPIISALYTTHLGSFPLAPNHYVKRTHGSSQAILIYCFKGAGWLKVKGKKIKIEESQVVVIPENLAHSYGTDIAEPWSIFWIHFSGTDSQALVDDLLGQSNNYLLNISDTALMLQAFEQLYACIDYNYSEAGLLLMSAKLSHLIGLIKLNHSPFSANNNVHKCSATIVQNSVSYMEQNLHGMITIESLAERAGVSIPHYCKSFKQKTNQTPITYFNRLKMRKACDLLYQTPLTIKAIAEFLGYTDPYYFSRLFKKIQGCSPKQYRQSIINEGLKHNH